MSNNGHTNIKLTSWSTFAAESIGSGPFSFCESVSSWTLTSLALFPSWDVRHVSLHTLGPPFYAIMQRQITHSYRIRSKNKALYISVFALLNSGWEDIESRIEQHQAFSDNHLLLISFWCNPDLVQSLPYLNGVILQRMYELPSYYGFIFYSSDEIFHFPEWCYFMCIDWQTEMRDNRQFSLYIKWTHKHAPHLLVIL